MGGGGTGAGVVEEVDVAMRYDLRKLICAIPIAGGLFSLFLFSCGEDGKKLVNTGDGDPYASARRILSEEFGLVNITLVIPVPEVHRQSTAFKNNVAFEDALRFAVKSFMEDDRDLESPLFIMKDGSDKSEQEAKELLFEYLNTPSTTLGLVFPDDDGDHWPPQSEVIESIQENWIFFLFVGPYGDYIHWAIVDRSGEQPAYNYGFN